MTERSWKRYERRIAAVLGGTRVPVTGRSRGDRPDVEDPRLSIEVKQRAHVLGWLLKTMAQAEAAAQADQIPVVVVHEVGQPYRRSVVMLRLEDFADWFGDMHEDKQRQAPATNAKPADAMDSAARPSRCLSGRSAGRMTWIRLRSVQQPGAEVDETRPRSSDCEVWCRRGWWPSMTAWRMH